MTNPIYVISVTYNHNNQTVVYEHGYTDYDAAVQYIESRDPKPSKILDRFNEWYSPCAVFKINIIQLSN